jgi:hypothetical protein
MDELLLDVLKENSSKDNLFESSTMNMKINVYV